MQKHTQHGVSIYVHRTTTIQLVITSLLKVSFQTFLSNLLQCFLSKYVWTSPHKQISEPVLFPPNYSQTPVYFTASLTLPQPIYGFQMLYESYSSLRTISEEEERAVTASMLVLTAVTCLHSRRAQTTVSRLQALGLTIGVWGFNYHRFSTKIQIWGAWKHTQDTMHTDNLLYTWIFTPLMHSL